MNAQEFFDTLLNFGENWKVDSIETGQELEVIINISYVGKKAIISETNELLGIYDFAPERVWRHLDILQYKTYIKARLPRVKSKEGSVTTITPSWANKSQRYTLLFEAYVIQLLLATKNQTSTAKLLRCGFNVINRIMHMATERGLSRRHLESCHINHLSLDEKSFKRGHNYVSVLSSPELGIILDVEEDRTIKATEKLLNKTLNKQQKLDVMTISIDMWKAYMKTAEKLLPNAKLVHDRFHMVKYLNEAIDKVRRIENKSQSELLVNSRYALLKNEKNLTEKQRLKFESIKNANLETSKAWQVRENFKSMFYQEKTLKDTYYLFKQWIDSSNEMNIKAVTKVVDMFQRHEVGVVHGLACKFSNAMAERLNGKIQMLKSVGRGYRTFTNFRSAILFFYGGLDLNPLNSG